MADQRISQLNELGQGSLEAGDLLPIVDSSSSETKKITAKSLFQGAANLADSSSIDLIKLNQASTTKLGVGALSLTGTDKIIGRFSAGAGAAEEITLTAVGRQLLDDATAADQRTTLGLGTLATQNGTFSGTHSGTSSGTNTGDQTITLTGDVTGTGTGSFATTIAESAVTTTKLPDGAIITAKIADDAVIAAKLADQSTTIIAATAPNVNGAFIGQQWFDTSTSKPHVYTAASTWTQSAGIVNSFAFTDTTPLSFSASVSNVGVATITTTLDTQSAGLVFAGPTAGAAAAPTFRALVAGDLPVAGASTNGAVQPGTGLGLSVNGAGVLSHTNSATAGTYTKVTIDAQGHVSAGETLSAADIPVLDTSKITTGTFAANLIGTNTITGEKLADYSTVQFGGAGSTANVVTFPTANFTGQLFWDQLNNDLYISTGIGLAWLPVTVTSGELILAGTFNASSGAGAIVEVTAAGTAAGFTAGPLPAPSSTNKQFYFVVSIGGTPNSGQMNGIELAPPDNILSTGAAWQKIDVSGTVVGSTAAQILYTAGGGIDATNVQAAIQELDTEKLAKAGGTVTGNLEIGTAGSLTFEGSSANDYETTIAVVDPTADRTITLPNATGTVITTGDTGTVTSTMISNDTILNADINSSAAIDYSKLAALTSANILVGSSANVATSRAVTGDVTINNTGVTAIASDVIINADIKSDAAIDYSKLAALTSANILVGSSANVATARAVTGDVLINNTGVTSINTGVIVNDDIAGGTITDAKLAQITTAGKVSGSAITTGNISTSGNITTTGTLTAQGLTVGKGAGAISTNTAVGRSALATNAIGASNVAVGDNALNLSTSSNNTAIGAEALASTTTGQSNTGVGELVLRSNVTGDFNVAMGGQALYSNTSGLDNVAYGYLALSENLTSSNNTAIGHKALLNTTALDNTAVGHFAGETNTTGINNVFIGRNAQGVAAGSNNTVTLGNSSITTLRCAATTITAISDRRDKKDIQSIPAGLNFIKELKPVAFKWATRDGRKLNIPEFGFIAQDLQQAQTTTKITVPNLVLAENPDQLEASPGTLIPILVKAIQELTAKVEALEARC